MSRVPHLLLKQLSVHGVQFEVNPSEPLEHFPQFVRLFLECLVDNDHINQVVFVNRASQIEFHEALKHFWSVAKSKGHN